jgi:hypothetical protein
LRRSLVIRVLMALGVLFFVVGPATASMSSAATAARHHHHHPTPPPPPAPVVTPGPIQLNPSTVTETSVHGGIGVSIWGVVGSEGTAKLNSPGLSAACAGGIYFMTGDGVWSGGTEILSLAADFGGNYNAILIGDGCPPGTFMVFAGSHGAALNILAPSTGTAFALSPASELQNTQTGTVGTTVVIQGQAPEAGGVVSSPNLAIACQGAANVWGLFSGSGAPSNLPIAFTTDYAGNALVGITATDCNAGTYQIDVSGVDLAFTVQN